MHHSTLKRKKPKVFPAAPATAALRVGRERSRKVCVAMSGGVDSSVAAALLKKAGYEVVGAFFVTWTQKMSGLKMCPWEQDVYDARRVCSALGIPLYTFNFEPEYCSRVIEYFFREYQLGRTPNPDVMCNREIKFGIFLEKAKDLGCDFIATGHYAQVRKTQAGFELRKAVDSNKDQSYFLYTLTQDQLRHALFPLGKLTKPEVRKLAKKFNLPNWDKPDSQGICFLGEVKVGDFLKTRIPVKPGNIVDTHGKVLGQHQGTSFYTIGQRHGLKIGGAGEPYFVVAKDHKKNVLIVSQKNADQAFRASSLILKNVSWVHHLPKLPMSCSVKIRYRQPDQPARLESANKNKIRVIFETPQRSATPGQSVVIYAGTRVLGGGVIDKVKTIV